MTNFTRRASMLALAGAGVAAVSPLPAFAQARGSSMERDRQAILAMAGDYRVRFNFTETVAFVPDYTPRDPSRSGGHESVRVIEDRGDFISLQHWLVAEHEGRTFIIKHWRQDWTYQPREVLVYERRDHWRTDSISAAARRGAWSQTVWQTDDSPRYGGIGVWSHDVGRIVWESQPTLRPLARRDAVRNPTYNHYRSINRHALLPNGWVHEQDNTKIGERDGQAQTIVQEDGFNTYLNFADYPVAAGDAYWRDTSEYWAGVRQAWDEAIARGRGRIRIAELAEWGSVTSEQLMGLADRIHDGELAAGPALTEARAAIAQATA